MQRINLTNLFLIALLACFLFPLSTNAQQDTIIKKDTLAVNDSITVDYYDMTIEQLQQLKAVGVSSELEQLINSLIGVASIKPLSGRESPSIISLITEEETLKFEVNKKVIEAHNLKIPKVLFSLGLVVG